LGFPPPPPPPLKTDISTGKSGRQDPMDQAPSETLQQMICPTCAAELCIVVKVTPRDTPTFLTACNLLHSSQCAALRLKTGCCSIFCLWFRASLIYMNNYPNEVQHKTVYLLFCKLTLHVSGIDHNPHQEYTKL